MRYKLVLGLFFLSFNTFFAQSYPFYKEIGAAKVKVTSKSLEIENGSLNAKWDIRNSIVYTQIFHNKETNQSIRWNKTPWFYIVMTNGERMYSSDFKLINEPVIESIKENANSVKKSDRYNGKIIKSCFYNEKFGLKITWEIVLKDESNYVQQQFTLSTKDSLRVDKIGLISLPNKVDLKSSGVVAGSPLIENNFFFAIEHPMSQIETTALTQSIFMKRYEPLNASNQLSFSTVWGVSAKNQMRRSFLHYLENERAVPYHQQLHYNSWFDISWVDRKLNEELCLDRIQTFADSLIVKRGVKMDAFLFDDGWDDNATLWQFNSGFPNGFSKLAALTKKYDSGIGVWISPWGGYDEAKLQRLEYGQKQNPPFETNSNGFSLNGENYYKRFFSVASGFVENQGVSMFKFDGVGAGDGSEGDNAAYEKDVDALLKLIQSLRSISPDLYFGLTVGTWPSPYWLLYGDAIWRNGDDTGLSGEGSNRQKWINFRDTETYNNIVKRGTLYPLNSLMYHGICVADHGRPDSLEMDDKDIADEIWSFFGTGTALQELYVNPHKLNKNNWDCLVKAIRWAKDNEDIMADTHWVGGSPADSQVYGYASWSPEKAILTLRNPSDKEQAFTVDVAKVFEIPEKFKPEYRFFDVKSENNSQPIASGSSFELVLAPFEVKVLNAVPAK